MGPANRSSASNNESQQSQGSQISKVNNVSSVQLASPKRGQIGSASVKPLSPQVDTSSWTPKQKKMAVVAAVSAVLGIGLLASGIGIIGLGAIAATLAGTGSALVLTAGGIGFKFQHDATVAQKNLANSTQIFEGSRQQLFKGNFKLNDLDGTSISPSTLGKFLKEKQQELKRDPASREKFAELLGILQELLDKDLLPERSVLAMHAGNQFIQSLPEEMQNELKASKGVQSEIVKKYNEEYEILQTEIKNINNITDEELQEKPRAQIVQERVDKLKVGLRKLNQDFKDVQEKTNSAEALERPDLLVTTLCNTVLEMKLQGAANEMIKQLQKAFISDEGVNLFLATCIQFNNSKKDEVQSQILLVRFKKLLDLLQQTIKDFDFRKVADQILKETSEELGKDLVTKKDGKLYLTGNSETPIESLEGTLGTLITKTIDQDKSNWYESEQNLQAFDGIRVKNNKTSILNSTANFLLELFTIKNEDDAIRSAIEKHEFLQPYDRYNITNSIMDDWLSQRVN